MAELYLRARIRATRWRSDLPRKGGGNKKASSTLHSLNIIAALGLALLLGSPTHSTERELSPAELMDILMWNREPIGGPFALIDHSGARRTDADFRGKFLLIYFGFTYCPDVCPTDLMQMGLAVEQLGASGERVQPLFISFDPERDKPGHLAEYVSLFHPRLIGLTGDAGAIKQTARAYKAYYSKVPRDDGRDYTFDHSGFVYLIDPNGRYLGFYPPGTSAERMVTILRPHLDAAR